MESFKFVSSRLKNGENPAISSLSISSLRLEKFVFLESSAKKTTEKETLCAKEFELV